MKILVLGSGGREHALAWSLSRSPRVTETWCAPGNGGISRDVKTVDIDGNKPGGIEELIAFAKEQSIDLTVVGPEATLVLGVVDKFEAAGLKIFGPNEAAAKLEGSKVFMKEILSRHNIPTAGFKVFDEPEAAKAHLASTSFPTVIKADGLAAGKGVIIAKDEGEARAAIDQIMVDKVFGDSGDRLIIEDFLPGVELTVISLTDGETVLPLDTAQDYKPALDGNEGPNTGGMGSYSPHIPLDSDLIQTILDTIVHPTLEGLKKEGIVYKGALYAGIMLTEQGPSVLEYNVRFGDPETQAILPRLTTDLVDLMEACCEGNLADFRAEWDPRPSVCVIGASQGYPASYPKGKVIEGLDAADALDDVKVFSAGIAKSGEDFITSGGRVLGATALGASREEAREKAYEALSKIQFEGLTHRSDIGIPTGEVPTLKKA